MSYRADKSSASAAKDIAQTVANFITAMDAIKLGLVAVDDVRLSRGYCNLNCADIF